jgi:hypothetical protein
MSTGRLGNVCFTLERVAHLEDGGSLFWLYVGDKAYVLESTADEDAKIEALRVLEEHGGQSVNRPVVIYEPKAGEGAPPISA